MIKNKNFGGGGETAGRWGVRGGRRGEGKGRDGVGAIREIKEGERIRIKVTIRIK